MLDMELFRRNPVFVFSNLAALIHYSATFAVSFLLSLYLQDVRGLGPRRRDWFSCASRRSWRPAPRLPAGCRIARSPGPWPPPAWP